EGRDVFGGEGLPRLQLFDRVAARWVEFEMLTLSETYRISEPERYIDSSGALRVRFVNRFDEGFSMYFSFQTRLEGTAR
ncbi:MAG: hypothetical protein M3432_06250, partial [Chloroflexota bacterium]|nr:hypothetical protein [Chloroflexota bacterium]